jgi:alanine racemase
MPHSSHEQPPPLLLPQTRVFVDLGAVAHNIRALKKLLSRKTKFMAVVKTDAYGHGVFQVARTVLENGADWLAVARISEAVELRKAGIDVPVLLFGDVLPDQVPFLAAHNIRVTLTNLETAREIAAAAKNNNSPLKIHIKVDTGMGRLGVLHDQLLNPGNSPASCLKCSEEILAIQALKGIEIEGIYTHLANADDRDKTHAQGQISRFGGLVTELAHKGLTPPMVHAANSAALIDMPQAHFNMVRPGIAIYGLWPSEETDHTKVRLKPAMSIRSKIIHLKKVPKGFKISYGSTHVTRMPTCIATIPIGYADGYSRLLSSTGEMIVRGSKAPIVGRVCMDFTMIDVGHIPGCKKGDEVVVMGSQGDETVSADDIARIIGTINYEITSSLTKRMPLCYGHPEIK